MTVSSDLSQIILPFIEQYRGQSLLLAGKLAQTTVNNRQDTRTQSLTTPFSLSQLASLDPIDLAILSDVVETLPQQHATEWLATLRNQYARRVLLIVNQDSEVQWSFTDYLALGFKKRADTPSQVLYSYAIEDYQFKKDWLNSRFWANPENFDKYRW